MAEAARLGLTWAHLQGESYRRLTRGVYAWSRLLANPPLMFRAVLRRLPANAVFSGRSAAWLHGLDVPACTPVQVTLPPDHVVAARAGVWIRRSPLDRDEVVSRRGFRATSILRTLIDIGQTLPLVEAVLIYDQALHAKFIDLDALQRAVEIRAGTWNVRRLRRVVDLVEPRSESQMESRLRVVLLLGGLPRPQAQVDLYDGAGEHIGRVDLYYPSHRLVIEYDGGTHRDSLVRDNRRQNHLVGAGYRIRRFTAADVFDRPDSVVAQIRGELAADPVAA
ncbi:MAG TPA: DUF559 domain-containing protein [Candidatus Dormibacteraeota bacterium]